MDSRSRIEVHTTIRSPPAGVPLPSNVVWVYNPHVPHRSSLIMEPGFAWLVWIALGFGVVAIIHQSIRLFRKPAICPRCGQRLKKIDGTWLCDRCV